MTRFGAHTAIALTLLGVGGGAFAADLPVGRYLDNPSLGAGGSGNGNFRPAPPVYRAPVAPAPTYHAPMMAAPTNAPPSGTAPLGPNRRNYAVPIAPPPVSPTPPLTEPFNPAPTGGEAAVAKPDGVPNTTDMADGPLFWTVLTLLTLACGALAVSYGLPFRRRGGSGFAAAADDFDSDQGGGGPRRALNNAVASRPNGAMTPAVRRSGFPSQDDWTRRAGTVRNPVSGFLFGVGARANARALDEEQKRMKSARGVIKEYAGMYKDLLEGEEAATAHTVRRDLSGAHYEHERAKQTDAFDEAAHRREVAGKRRKKELTEADTRRIEAEHEQEAVERFKEPKFAAGMARFEAKSKEHLVGAATADAAIAETKETAQQPEDANENAEVMQLYRLLQSAMAAIEEGERLGRDTQALRERAELCKKLLNLA